MFFLYSNSGCYLGVNKATNQPKWGFLIHEDLVRFETYGQAVGAINELRRDKMDWADQLCVDCLTSPTTSKGM